MDAKAQPFKTIICILVNINAYTKPPKEDQEQWKCSIAECAQAFVGHSKITTPHVFYNLYNVGGMACFYYGTQLLILKGFLCVGIQPFKNNIDFFPFRTFYVIMTLLQHLSSFFTIISKRHYFCLLFQIGFGNSSWGSSLSALI